MSAYSYPLLGLYKKDSGVLGVYFRVPCFQKSNSVHHKVVWQKSHSVLVSVIATFGVLLLKVAYQEAVPCTVRVVHLGLAAEPWNTALS